MKNDGYEVEKAVDFSISHTAREPAYHIRWQGYRPSQDQWIHSDDIDAEINFICWQEEDLKATLQIRRCHIGSLGPTNRRSTLSDISGDRDGVMQSIMRTSTLQFEEPVADQLCNLILKSKRISQNWNPTDRDGKIF